MKHTQHTKLPKPNKGFYGRNEISILGSNCNNIKKVAHGIGSTLGNAFKIAYIDADHASHNYQEEKTPSYTFTKDFINKITYHQFNTYTQASNYENDVFFNSEDLILVNGNHEKGNHQIVIIDKKKEASLTKRKAALTHVIALIKLQNESIDIPEYIKTLIPNYAELPVIELADEKTISHFVTQFLEARKPILKGLILGGGKSTRMGIDKIFIDYHGIPQHSYLQSIMTPFCDGIFTSCRPEQANKFTHPITDTFLNIGAYSGLLSAFQKTPNAAWFTIACDIPLLDKTTIEQLVARRNTSKVATCFYNSETQFPEPLITIWEPRAYPILLHYLSLGYSCTRKVLINNDVEVVKLSDETVLQNVNTSEERKTIMKILSKTP